MAYSRDYNERIEWENFPSTNTAVDADNLNKMDYAIFEHDKKIVELDGRVETVKESVTEDVTQAKEYSDLSKEYALESKNFSEQSLDYANQSKSYIDDSKAEADRAYSEAERAKLYADTVQEGITTTTDRELTDSQAGGIRIISMDGESQQNGTPTPNEEVAIESVEISEIGTHWKNLLEVKREPLTNNGITFTCSGDGGVIVNGTNSGTESLFGIIPNIASLPSIIKRETEYIASLKDNGLSVGFQVYQYVGSSWSMIANVNGSNNNIPFVISKDATGLQIRLRVSPNVSISNKIVYPMIRKSDVEDATYEPYTETKETLSAPIVLRGIGDVKDRVVKKDGVYGVLRKIKEVDLSIITSWSKDSSFANKNAFYKYNYLSDAVTVSGYYTVANLSCNRLITYGSASITSQEIDGIAQGGGASLYVSVIGKTTSADLVSYFAENETYIHYELATPTFEPLPLADQIALHKLETFGGVTYLFTDSTIEPIIEVEYGTSKVGGYAIKGLNNGEISLLELEQLKTLTNELATQIVAGSEA